MKLWLGILVMGLCIHAGELPAVQNPLIPAGKAKNIVFIEDLRFGGEDESEEDHYLWTGVTPTVAAAPNGHIFVADTGSNRIMEYDKQGKYVGQLGQEGEGPGEYRRVFAFSVLADGNAIGIDQRGNGLALVHYDTSMKFSKESEPVLNLVRLMTLSADGRHAFAEFMALGDANVGINRGWVNRQTKQTEVITHTELERQDPSQFDKPSYHRDRIAQIMALECTSRGIAGFGRNGEVYSANSNRYTITAWKDGKKVRLIRKLAKPQAINDQEMEAIYDDFHGRFQAMLGDLRDMITRKLIKEAYAKAGLTEFKDPLIGLIVMPDGHLLAVQHPDFSGKQTADIFDTSGKLIGQTSLPGRGFFDNEWQQRLVFRGDYAYTLETQEGEHEVVRYRYKFQ